MNASEQKPGVLLANLGTPDSPSPQDVRRYLKEFLWDRRVVDTPRLLWWPILNGIILNTRPKRSAAAYAKVWTAEGSPLLSISRRQAEVLQAALPHWPVALGMRYGNPSIAGAIDELRRQGVDRFLVLPLYPQFSYTTTASVEDAVAAVLAADRYRMVVDYHDHPDYIAAVAASIEDHWREHGRADRLLMSFHGIPQDYSNRGDPYRSQCMRSGELIANALGLAEDDWALTFQSRLGPKQWLTPYTDHTLEAWGRDGLGSVDVVCPGFSVDCLETLEEVAMENRDIFQQAGGGEYRYIPCLNDSGPHIRLMASLLNELNQDTRPAGQHAA